MKIAVVLAAALLLVLTPESLWAWGPTTHAFLGSRILTEVHLLPLVVRELLGAYPHQYLYGSLAADITLAKRYVHYSRHCHNWNVAYEILDRAETPPLQAFALGYLSHLAADTLAHNVFVPRMLATTPLSSNLGHTYWEYRFDAELGEEPLALAREIVTMDHDESDALLESALTQAFFSFQTNKRIYQQLIHLSNQERWKNLWTKMADRSRWELDPADVESYERLAREYVVDFLVHGASALSHGFDPTGTEALVLAKKLRHQSYRAARRQAGREIARLPIIELRVEDATRLLAARPVSAADLVVLAEVFFPMLPRPNGAGPTEWFEERDPRAFWGAFSAGRALPAGS